MRTTADRIRHTLLFEGCGIILGTALATYILQKPIMTIASLAVTLSVLAMLCNYGYNLAFDHWLARRNGGQVPQTRSTRLRMMHAVLFEFTFLLLSVPLVAWWLDMTLLQAFLTDLGFALFFMVYTYLFNWAYDHLFPLPVTTDQATKQSQS